jgi:hypothetical protein
VVKRKIVLSAALGLGIVTGAWLVLQSSKMPQRSFLPRAAPAEPVTVYRWQNEEGVSVFSSQLPPPGVAYTTDVLDGRLNIVESVKPIESPPKEAEPTINPFSVYTPEGMQQLIQQAHQAKSAVEQSQQRTINQIESQR